MKIESIKCDVCGKVKGEANKWLAIYVDGDNRNPGISICRYEQGRASMWEDICSDTCLYKRLGQVLTLIRDEPSHTSDLDSIPTEPTLPTERYKSLLEKL